MSRLTSPLSFPWGLSWWGDRRPAAATTGEAVPPAGEVSFATGATMSFAPSAGLRIRCVVGSLWVTQAGDGRDFLLGDGDCFLPARRGKVVVHALEPSRFWVAHAPPERARVCSRPAGYPDARPIHR
ncbi:MAG: hypothetical protein JWO31_1713 [Phycisphaerales bacterium]|nr:hypothetical protein [Phycisphaerales bacterium]